MSRNVTRELGVNWQTLGGTAGRYAIGFANPAALAVTQGVATLTNSYTNTGTSIANVISALADDNLARMLAQPNLTAMSGETGELPRRRGVPDPGGAAEQRDLRRLQAIRHLPVLRADRAG